MNNWFECVVKYDKVNEAGKLVSVKEHYLVDALSFTEAEARIVEEMKPYMSGEFSVSAVRRSKFVELFANKDDKADKWYRCKLFYLTIDEKNGIEKRTGTTMLVQAADLRDALDVLSVGMESYMGDYDVVSITETGIMDVYPYEV